jgi:anti-sigma B factor antagonist
VLNFDVSTESEGDSALVRFTGDLDIQVAERAATAVEGVEADGPKLLVIDLSGLSFMDSSGMAVVAAAHARALEADRRFVIVNPRGGVRRAFEVSGLDQSVETVDDLAAVYPAGSSGAS